MSKLLIPTIALFSIPNSGTAQTINSIQSLVTFSVKNMKFKTVEGSFKGMTGDVDFNANNLDDSSFNVCIDASTIDTGNSSRDKHLKNEDFFEVDTYPQICYKSNKIIQSDNGYIVEGVLSMHGVTKSVNIPFTHKENKLIGKFNANRTDYNVGGSGSFMVGHNIEIKIECVLQ